LAKHQSRHTNTQSNQITCKDSSLNPKSPTLLSLYPRDGEQINELPDDQKAGFIGKMHSPEMQDRIKSTFTSEAFQDHVDKAEAEKGVGPRVLCPGSRVQDVGSGSAVEGLRIEG